MKQIILGLAIVSLLMSSCSKDPVVDLPASVNLGESIVYLNGEVVSEYVPVFAYVTVYNHMNFSFVETKNNGQLINAVGFGLLPPEIGDYTVNAVGMPNGNAFTNFGQTVAEDIEGYSYKLVDPGEGFFKIETLDTLNRQVSGRFRAKFCRTSRNGNRNLDMPKHVIFEGVFNEVYAKY